MTAFTSPRDQNQFLRQALVAELAVEALGQSTARACPDQCRCDEFRDDPFAQCATDELRTIIGTKNRKAPGFDTSRESDDEYERRLASTTLTNMVRQAVLNAVGRPFSKPVRLSQDSAQITAMWAEDIDLEGHDLNVWCRRAFREALLDGMVHALADHVAVPTGINAKEFMALGGGRPYLSLIPAQHLVAAYTDMIGGVKRCVHARIREWHTYLSGFREIKRERVRVLEPGTYALYENGPSGWAIIEEGELRKANGELWPYVPLETFYTGTSDVDYIVTPPFLDLAYKNIEHWQSTSDQRNILTKGRFPMLAARGVDPASVVDTSGKFIVGPHTALINSDPQSMWYYLEPGGASIEAGRKDLESLMEDMRLLALDPVNPQAGGGMATATGKTIDEAKARAPLEVWARDFAGFMDRNFVNMAEWLSLNEMVEGPIAKVEMNTDFGLNIADMSELTTLTSLRGMREITRSTLYHELKRRQVLAENFDPDLEEAMLEIEQQNAMMGMMGAPGQEGAAPAEAPPAPEEAPPQDIQVEEPKPKAKSKSKAKGSSSGSKPKGKSKAKSKKADERMAA